MGRGPIQAGGVARKLLVPARRGALHEGPPQSLLLLIGVHLIHVVAGAEAQHGERLAHRVGAGAAKASSDHLECHARAPEFGVGCVPVLGHSFSIGLHMSTA